MTDDEQEVALCEACKGKGILIIGFSQDKTKPWRWLICRICQGRGEDPTTGHYTAGPPDKWRKAESRVELEFISLEVRLKAPSNPQDGRTKEERIQSRIVRRAKITALLRAKEEEYFGGPIRPETMAGETSGVAEGVHEEVQRGEEE